MTPTVPVIYAYDLPGVPDHAGCIKIGYTERDPMTRIREQTLTVGITARLLLTVPAIRPDGSAFRDTDIHAVLERNGFTRKSREWFRCTLDDVKKAIFAVKHGRPTMTDRTREFTLRPEQVIAVKKTREYFMYTEARPPKFLWNAKMRFGKTFTAYQLCKEMGFMKILVLTFKPAAESAWSDDIYSHVDFEGWQFISNHGDIPIDLQFSRADMSRPVVVFGSFQDLLGRNANGGIKAKNEFIHAINWDIVIFDEYHFGAWRENARRLFEFDEERDADVEPEYADDESDILPITANHYLYLSGTPFRALNSGEFIEEQIYSWTYPDEQRAKAAWTGENNPYASMPQVVMMTYQIPESIRNIAMQGEFDGFDLNEFFAVRDGRFKHEDEVRKWLLLIRGAYLPFEREGLKLERRPPMPYADSSLIQTLRHTLWFMPDVASCRAMGELLRSDAFFRDYEAVVCAGRECGNGIDALVPVMSAMGDPLETKTITLSCGKLTSGVTVPAWSAIFMLRNLKSPETYFQAAFRVQSPFVERERILKPECYIFDFALDRALKQIADYSCRLNTGDDDPEKKAEEFVNFMPVLAFDGASMRRLDAQDVLDFATAGTSATLLAKRWESALLVNVDTETLRRLKQDDDALRAVMNITGLRALNKDIEKIITHTEHIRDLKRDDKNNHRKEISREEKENRDLRKAIQEKLMKFVTRIPVFMYLTDEREKSLKDVIRQIEPGLFQSVTGLTIADFDRLCGLGVFNSEFMNDAIYKFKRYEDSSLGYTGLEK